jgi:hypothetical protein
MIRIGSVSTALLSVISLYAGKEFLDRAASLVKFIGTSGAVRVSVSGAGADGTTRRAIRGATVSLSGTPLRVLTDSAGTAMLENVDAGDYVVEVTTPTTLLFGEPPSSAHVSVHESGVVATAVTVLEASDIVARRCGDTLQDVIIGIATNRAAAIPGVEVSVFDDGGPESKFLTAFRTTSDGRFVFCVARKRSSGEFAVRMRSEDGSRISRAVHFSRGEHVVVVGFAFDDRPPPP